MVHVVTLVHMNVGPENLLLCFHFHCRVLSSTPTRIETTQAHRADQLLNVREEFATKLILKRSHSQNPRQQQAYWTRLVPSKPRTMRPVILSATVLASTITTVLSSPIQALDVIGYDEIEVRDSPPGIDEKCFLGSQSFEHGTCKLSLQVVSWGAYGKPLPGEHGLKIFDNNDCEVYSNKTTSDAYHNQYHLTVPEEYFEGKRLRILVRQPCGYSHNIADFVFGDGEDAKRWTSGYPDSENGMCTVGHAQNYNPNGAATVWLPDPEWTDKCDVYLTCAWTC